MSELDQLQDAIAAARAAAGNVVNQSGTSVAPVAPAVPSVVSPGRAVTLDEMLTQSGMQVDDFIKVDKAGFYIGKDTTTPISEIEVEFKLLDATPFYGLRYGNPAKYLRSYDRLTEARSKRPWADQIAEAQRLDNRVRGDYASVDVPFTVLNTIKDKKGDKVLIEAGKKLGWTASVTNFKDFADFARPYNQLGATDVLLRGKLVHEQKKDSSNVWGALTFVDFAPVVASADSAQAEAA